MIYLIIYLIGVIAAAIAIFKYEKYFVDKGVDYTLDELIFNVITAMISWFGFFAVLFALMEDIVIIKGKRKWK